MNSFGTFKWVSVWIILWYKDSGREGHSRVAKLKLILSDLWLFQPKRSYNVFFFFFFFFLKQKQGVS